MLLTCETAVHFPSPTTYLLLKPNQVDRVPSETGFIWQQYFVLVLVLAIRNEDLCFLKIHK